MNTSLLKGVPWRQLTDLKLRLYPGTYSAVEIVWMCPELKSFSLLYDTPSEAFEIPKDFHH
ncbi:hypothetical protein PQX77_007100, partial [Marasmius sp. AFHP31]